jgi:hypothetical protein
MGYSTAEIEDLCNSGAVQTPAMAPQADAATGM